RAFLRGLNASVQLYDGFVEAGDMADFLARLRWQAEGPMRLIRARQSALSATSPFRALAERVLQRPLEFRRIYNREAGRRRTFRPLRKRGDRVETPLWILQGHRRRPLWVAASGGRLPELEGLRPRALLWTAFLRLACCDLYLHGTGGAGYDRVLARFFEVTPPAYAVVSLSLPVEMPGLVTSRELARKLRELEFHPERMLPRHPLIREKRSLVEAISTAPRGLKRDLTLRLREVNRALAEDLSDQRRRLEEELAARSDAEDPVSYRGYSWLCHSPERLRRVVANLLPFSTP
ncbi:MAG: hypothetical protein AB1758_35310, partial [Candidatus Eremiobacterota bacterium]